MTTINGPICFLFYFQSGNYTRDDVVGNLIQLISETTSLHAYAVQQCWKHLADDLPSKQPLVQVAMWTIGEFADLLNEVCPGSGDDLSEPLNVQSDEIVATCEEITASSLMSIVTKEYTINTLIKLSARYPNCAPKIKSIVDAFGCHMNVELQQRSVEFSTIFTKHNQLRLSLLEKMPPMKSRDEKRENLSNGQTGEEDLLETLSKVGSNSTSEAKSDNTASSAALLDLLSTVDMTSPSPFPPTTNQVQNTTNNNSAIVDLLGLINSEPTSSSNGTLINTTNNSLSENNDSNSLKYNSLIESNLFDGFDSFDTPIVTSAAQITPQIPSLVAYDANGLKLTFDFEKNDSDPKTLIIRIKAQNSYDKPMLDFRLQAAGPKVSITNDPINNQLISLN